MCTVGLHLPEITNILVIIRLILMVTVMRPLEGASTPSSKTVGDREKCFRVNMSGATRITLR